MTDTEWVLLVYDLALVKTILGMGRAFLRLDAHSGEIIFRFMFISWQIASYIWFNLAKISFLRIYTLYKISSDLVSIYTKEKNSSNQGTNINIRII